MSPLVLMLAAHQTGGDIFSVWEGLDWCSWSPSYTPSDHLIDQSGQQSVRGLAWPPARPSALQDLPPPQPAASTVGNWAGREDNQDITQLHYWLRGNNKDRSQCHFPAS